MLFEYVWMGIITYYIVHLISWIMHFSYICFPCAPTLGEPRCEEHHCCGPKGFQQTRTCAAPVIGEQQLDPSASGPLRRQEALSSVGQRNILHSSAKASSMLRGAMQWHNLWCSYSSHTLMFQVYHHWSSWTWHESSWKHCTKILFGA